MKFEDALKLMREGKEVRCNKDKKYSFVFENGRMCSYKDGIKYVSEYLSADSIFNGDWRECKKPILDNVERKYLEAVLRPFKGEIGYVILVPLFTDHYKVYIHVSLEDSLDGNGRDLVLPAFKRGTMYKGMVIGKKYSPKELGLFADE